jgi:hypothetical protein
VSKFDDIAEVFDGAIELRLAGHHVVHFQGVPSAGVLPFDA